MNGESGEKTFQPTAKKLEDARKKGDVVRSSDVSVAAGYLGLVLALTVFGADSVTGAGDILSGYLGRADQLTGRLLGPGGRQVFAAHMGQLLHSIVWVFLLPFTLVILSVLAQNAFVFVPDKIKFKLSRISPLSVTRNKFGPTGLFEFGKSLTKLLIYTLAVTIFYINGGDVLIGAFQSSARGVSFLLVDRMIAFLWFVFGLALAVSAVDYLWQVYDHQRKLMMSRTDIKDEHKQAEGDPLLKQMRRQMGYDIATTQMIADVATADVVIVNPTHFAVALKWSRESQSAPVCVAKGVDEIAARIREAAVKHKVPVHSDPPSARAIYAVVDVGQEIHPEHYKAVAIAIRFSENMRRRRPA